MLFSFFRRKKIINKNKSFKSDNACFKIPQFIKVEGIRQEGKFKASKVISPVFGKRTRNDKIKPDIISDINVDERYDYRRSDESKRIKDDGSYKEYGDYILTNADHEKYLGVKVYDKQEEERLDVKKIIDNPTKKIKPIGSVKTIEKNIKSYEDNKLEDIYIDETPNKYINPYHELEPINPVNTPVNNSNPVFEENIEKPENKEDDFSLNNDNIILEKEEINEDINPIEDREIIDNEEDENLELIDDSINDKEDILFRPGVEDFNPSNQNEEKLDSESDKLHNIEFQKEETKSYIIPEEQEYILPPVSLFSKKALSTDTKPDWLVRKEEILNQTFNEFGVEGFVAGTKKGPTVTRFEIELAPGISVKKISGLEDNIMMNLASKSIRIEAPIPGKPYVGIEVPNDKLELVSFGNCVDRKEFFEPNKPLKVALGVDIDGEYIYTNIAKMPHGLVAGATNSGKSVCVNTILVSLLLKNKPEDLRLLLIDPKFVELTPYNGIPHLLTPVISDARKAAMALKWVVNKMDSRYVTFAKNMVRDIDGYNDGVKDGRIQSKKMPRIVIIIDELADLMMVAANDVEYSIQRITQKARAAGIHLIVATQRPTTDVVKGTIKSNIPTRLAFKVASFVDSTTILDGAGAETLLGRGDMLYKEGDHLHRLQGAYIPDKEIFDCINFIRNQSEPNYEIMQEDLDKIERQTKNPDDPLLETIALYVTENEICSTSDIQQVFSMGHPRAKNIMLRLEELGIVETLTDGKTTARKVLVRSRDEARRLLHQL